MHACRSTLEDPTCQAGTPPNCTDAFACTADACNETTDQCDHTPNNAACSDGLFCNGNETCNVMTGCQPGTPVNCADSVACTVDACNEATDQCDHTPNNAACSDGQFCNGTEVCNVALGCQAGTPTNCGDGISCTVDTCNETTDSCDHTPNNAACSDGQFCNGTELCSLATDCGPGTPVSCSDGVACTTDSCNEATDSCDHTAVNAACSDGLFCDGIEICDPLLGCHSGPSVNCTDANACTTDACNETLHRCQNVDTCCGDGVIEPGEECDPPNDEDCNNGIDDDGDGREDCRDIDSCADPNNPEVGIVTCGKDCKLDPACTRIRRDPATITFGKNGGPDRLRIHGRFKLSSPVDPLGESMAFSLENDHASIYRGELVPGDLKPAGNGFGFKDATAARTGIGIRDGLASVRMKYVTQDDGLYLSFVLIAYGDMSAAREPWMTSQIVVGNDAAYLRAPWILLKNGWKLKDVVFAPQ